MPEHSDGIAEELERQLRSPSQQRRSSPAAASLSVNARSSKRSGRASMLPVPRRADRDRTAARGRRLRPVFDEAWWRTATPAEIAGMWEEANSWRDPAAGDGSSVDV